jgi:hypothetical protein
MHVLVIRLDREPSFDDVGTIAAGVLKHGPEVNLGEVAVRLAFVSGARSRS